MMNNANVCVMRCNRMRCWNNGKWLTRVRVATLFNVKPASMSTDREGRTVHGRDRPKGQRTTSSAFSSTAVCHARRAMSAPWARRTALTGRQLQDPKMIERSRRSGAGQQVCACLGNGEHEFLAFEKF